MLSLEGECVGPAISRIWGFYISGVASGFPDDVDSNPYLVRDRCSPWWSSDQQSVTAGGAWTWD